MCRKWKKNLSLFWKSWLFSVLVALLVATSFKSAIADWNVVPTGSMKPTIVEGDRIFVNKLAYDLKIPYTKWHIAKWGDPKRGEIVVFYSPEDNKRLVKRVIGLPGDSIAMRNNYLFINGKPIAYAPIKQQAMGCPLSDKYSNQYYLMEDLGGRNHPVMISPHHPSFHSFGPTTVPKGHFFMMGDNRDNSADSRYFGFVERSRIVGHATAIVVSLDINNYYRPRWKRFFTRLP